MMKGNKKQYQTATEMYISYANKVNSYDSLTAQEEQVLWDRVEKGDKKALEIIIKACLKYVYGYSLKWNPWWTSFPALWRVRNLPPCRSVRER